MGWKLGCSVCMSALGAVLVTIGDSVVIGDGLGALLGSRVEDPSLVGEAVWASMGLKLGTSVDAVVGNTLATGDGVLGAMLPTEVGSFVGKKLANCEGAAVDGMSLGS